MKTDHELDVELAKKLFGWEHDPEIDCVRGNHQWYVVSDDGDAIAWSSTGDGMLAVLEAMRERGWHYALYDSGFSQERPAASFSEFDGDRLRGGDGSAPTLPRAVAEAALSALEGRGEERETSQIGQAE